ncbi:MAG: RNA polymerase subunit sigma-24 [Pseudonocardiales bacterium]|nr:MAG: RNA polymerase subunit sigma-24 [Pseudonocardiales bacterium]
MRRRRGRLDAVAGDAAGEFETHRTRLFGLAYRLLGSAEEAEDVVQDAFLRWGGADRSTITTPSAWLAKVVINLSLNRLTSAHARRERYVGPWLPEPVLTSEGALGPMELAEQCESVSLGLLVLMEQLTPSERAVFILREAFDYSHREVGELVGVSEANSRQLHHRARQHVHRRRAGRGERVEPSGAQRRRWQGLVDRFLRAAQDGDLAGLEELLSAEVTAWADGGGAATAARRPVVGRARVARYLIGAIGKFGAGAGAGVRVERAEINGCPSLLGWSDAVLLGVLVPEVEGDRVVAVHIIANPDKLRFAARQAAGLSRSGGPPGS